MLRDASTSETKLLILDCRNWIIIIGLSYLDVRIGLSKPDWKVGLSKMDCKNGYFSLSYINLNCKYIISVFWELKGQKYIREIVVTVLIDLSHQIHKHFL